MVTTKYSHEFLVGSFNGDIKPQQLENDKRWTKEVISLDDSNPRYERDKGYNGLCTLYYKAHLDAMLEADTIKRPDFLCTGHHYIHDLEKAGKDSTSNNEIVLPLKKGKYPNFISFDYSFRICRLHLYFFPLDILLFAIEIDDTGTELDNLTAAHYSLMVYWDADSFNNKRLSELMKPLTQYLNTTNSNRLTKDGNKLKLFQTVKIEASSIEDDLLYELGTSSPVGCVKHGIRPDLKPSDSYFNEIIKENQVSTFDNWKGLALMDSFTMLGKEDSFEENDCNYLYFPLIYLRCIFEKTFCFSRNNAYREDDKEKNKALPEEIEKMEKFYFYDNISYNFQPNLLYKAMSKGLDIKEEREAISKQIKERAKEEKRLREMKEAQDKDRLKEEAEKEKEVEAKRFDRVMAYVAIFAVFSVIWDICSILMASSETLKRTAWTARSLFIVGVVLSLFFVWLIQRNKKKRNKSIYISPEVRSHLSTHFLQNLPGSKFYSESPEGLLEEAMRMFPETFHKAKPDDDGRIRISLTFPREIGVSNVVSLDELTDEENSRIEIIDRSGKKVRSVRTDRIIPTNECQIILSNDWHLITMFPGEMAPPLPDSPDVHNEYWDHHVFIESID